MAAPASARRNWQCPARVRLRADDGRGTARRLLARPACLPPRRLPGEEHRRGQRAPEGEQPAPQPLLRARRWRGLGRVRDRHERAHGLLHVGPRLVDTGHRSLVVRVGQVWKLDYPRPTRPRPSGRPGGPSVFSREQRRRAGPAPMCLRGRTRCLRARTMCLRARTRCLRGRTMCLRARTRCLRGRTMCLREGRAPCAFFDQVVANVGQSVESGQGHRFDGPPSWKLSTSRRSREPESRRWRRRAAPQSDRRPTSGRPLLRAEAVREVDLRPPLCAPNGLGGLGEGRVVSAFEVVWAADLVRTFAVHGSPYRCDVQPVNGGPAHPRVVARPGDGRGQVIVVGGIGTAGRPLSTPTPLVPPPIACRSTQPRAPCARRRPPAPWPP